MVSYNWSIKNLERDTSTGGVTKTFWKVSASDNGLSATSSGVSRFTPNPSSESFVPYDELTVQTVLEWVHNDVNKDAIEQALSAEVASDEDQDKATGTPW